jgi:CRISPR-associated protein Csd1
MILQALKEYYDRKKSELPREGYKRQAIKYVVIIDENGNLMNIEDTTESKQSKKFIVPEDGKGLSFGWGNAKYTLGIGKNADKKHKAFKDKMESLGNLSDKGFKALNLFLSKDNKAELISKISRDILNEFEEKNSSIIFKFRDSIIIDSEEIQNQIDNIDSKNEGDKQICLISGKPDKIARVHPKIKKVRDCVTMGANLVAFQVNSGYDSYGKEQGYNAPCGQKAVSAYAIALNHLLDSSQRMQVGDASTVFWSAKPTEFENKFASFFNIPPKDNPDAGAIAVKALFESIENGSLNNDDGKQEFYVLGLSPNAARISVRFFIKDTIKKMSKNIAQYFKDLEIVRPPFENEFLPLFKLLVSTAVQNKAENIPPHLAGDFMMSALKGLPYPSTLLQSIINRIKAEQNITYVRAALIKAYLNRLARYKKQKEEIQVSLDKENKNQGYVLGRLFATLEKLQEEAHKREINSTIIRYYGSASSCPVSVFSNLMRLHYHHLEKLDNPNRAKDLKKLIGEINGKININGNITYPTHLSLIDQGNFSVGYYHQRQDFFTKKEDKINEAENKTKGE